MRRNERHQTAIVTVVVLLRTAVLFEGMNGPRLPPSHPDRQLECEDLMEARLVALMDRTRERGWTQEEVADAAIALAYNHVLRHKENEGTGRQIAEAIAPFRTN